MVFSLIRSFYVLTRHLYSYYSKLMNTTLPKYFIVTISSLVLIPLLFVLSSTLVKSAADHIVISEVQIAGDVDAQDEFVEIYNPTSNTVDLTDWQLRVKTATGTTFNLLANISGNLAPNTYMLIAHTDYDGLLIEDVTYSTQSIAANNTVMLEDQNNVEVDKVGLGTAADVETSSVANPEPNGSVRRVNNDDSNNNSVDFEIIMTSDPQNSTITVTPTATTSPSPSVSPTATATSTATASPIVSPTATSTATASPTATATSTATASPTVTATATATSTPTSTPRNIATFFFPNRVCRMQIQYVRFGFFRMPFALVVCDRI